MSEEGKFAQVSVFIFIGTSKIGIFKLGNQVDLGLKKKQPTIKINPTHHSYQSLLLQNYNDISLQMVFKCSLHVL